MEHYRPKVCILKRKFSDKKKISRHAKYSKGSCPFFPLVMTPRVREYVRTSNKDRSNSVKRGIADRCCHLVNHKSSFFRTAEAIACYGWEFDPPDVPFHGSQEPHLTQSVLGPHKCTCQLASEFIKRRRVITNATDDRQTDRPRYEEMCSYRRNRLRCKKRFRLKSATVWRVF